MVNCGPAALDLTFGALADPTRRAILARLSRGQASVSELAAPFDMSLPAVLKHVTTLTEAGLVTAEKDGRVRRCRLETEPLDGALSWIARYRRFWDGRFDALEDYLRKAGGEEEDWRPQDPPQAAASPSASGSRAPSRRRASGSSRPSRGRKG